MVDAGRLPVYIAKGSSRILELAIPISIAVAGVLIGTMVGEAILLRLSRDRFQRIVSIFVIALGVWLLIR